LKTVAVQDAGDQIVIGDKRELANGRDHIG
jgi:hypothetical protein